MKVSLLKLKIFTLFLLLSTQLALAVPTKNSVLDENLRLAMLDLDRYGLEKAKVKSIQIKSLNNNKILNAKKRSQRYPSNCMRWTADQINQKAKRFEKPINNYSRQYGVDKDLVKSVITVESCFKIKAKSSAGAQGLMQLIPATASRFGVSKSYNPQQNIRGGVKYLKFLQARYKGNIPKILAAYNAGEGAVDKYKGIPPYKETKAYVKKVLEIYARLNPKIRRVSATYSTTKKGNKPGRHGWKYNKKLAPHLYKQ